MSQRLLISVAYNTWAWQPIKSELFKAAFQNGNLGGSLPYLNTVVTHETLQCVPGL